MKKYILGLFAAASVGFCSCDTLDGVNPTGYYSEDVAYNSVEHLDMTVKNFYAMYHNFADIECGAACTSVDDMGTDLLRSGWYNTNSGCFNKFFFQDNYVTVESNFRSNWNTMYNHIVRQNQFLYDVQRGMIKLDGEVVKVRAAEVRFLRALAYQELIVRHGGVILRLVGPNGADSSGENAKARSTEKESWDFVIDEYTEVAKLLPAEWPATETGRATKGAALGMKARACLYAGRWQDAIDACNDLIDLGLYDLLPGKTVAEYNQIYTVVNNRELIIPVYFEIGTKQHSWNSWVGPTSDGAAYGVEGTVGAGITPTEEYVSQFDIKNGENWETFDWDKHGANPFVNREPRFYASILYNGATWNKKTIDMAPGGADECMTYTGLPKDDNVHKSTTGYMIRKFLTTKTYNYTNTLSDQYWIEMRMAEIYLIRSEAYARLNQWTDAYNDLNKIRTRVGLPDKGVKSSWDEYLEDLQKERICELGLEGHRYNDIMRWNIHQKVLNGQRTHGIKITKGADGKCSYEVITVDLEDRKFPVKYSIFPIPYSEVQNNPLCEQNDLWK